ncbi:recombinase family protein [Arsenicibacter rosenii]|uniref:Resolvase n=1 Tax=Arsenicibacter rosenii TaxID=1750698 RepID=A0A1S2VHC9_9BACT|nr:recombinase family protein [Arsenicibacter rosenii]OIN57616.1 resolvase [Arsenicibacter rosenii]
MRFGYARVSTSEQNLDMQLQALMTADCDKIYYDTLSGTKRDRPQLEELLKALRSGDEVVVWRLDRLGRSLVHLIELVNNFSSQGISFSSLHEKIDTSSPSGKLIFHIFCSLAEFERELIRERTMAGLESARRQGRTGGRPKGMSEDAESTARIAETLFREKHTVTEIAKRLKKSKVTVYKYLRERGVEV